MLYQLVLPCSCEFREILIQGLNSSEHCSRNRLAAVFKLSGMNAGRKNSSLTPKKSAKPPISDACCLCGVNFKISVGDFGGKNTEYIFTLKGLWS